MTWEAPERWLQPVALEHETGGAEVLVLEICL